MLSLLHRSGRIAFPRSVHAGLRRSAALRFDSVIGRVVRPYRGGCPLAEKAIFENHESNQRLADFRNANFGLAQSRSGAAALPATWGGLRFPPASMQDELRIAIRLRASLEHQITRRLKRRTVEARRHRPIMRIVGILPVHHRGHSLQGLHYPPLAGDAMMQPVGDVLAGDA